MNAAVALRRLPVAVPGTGGGSTGRRMLLNLKRVSAEYQLNTVPLFTPYIPTGELCLFRPLRHMRPCRQASKGLHGGPEPGSCRYVLLQLPLQRNARTRTGNTA